MLDVAQPSSGAENACYGQQTQRRRPSRDIITTRPHPLQRVDGSRLTTEGDQQAVGVVTEQRWVVNTEELLSCAVHCEVTDCIWWDGILFMFVFMCLL